jgi:hypothetical protein
MENEDFKIKFQIPLVERDAHFFKIQELINYKQKMLLEKHKKLKVILKHNSFLDTVKDDYVVYYQYISQQKQQQMEALQILNDYIEGLTLSGELTRQNIEDAKIEQINILREIKSIKRNLDSIINNVKEINLAV